MALTETLDLDIRAAQAQISRLETQLDTLSRPVHIPVDISNNSVDGLNRDINRADTEFGELNSEIRETQTELRQLDRIADTTGEGVLRVGTRGVSAFTSIRAPLVGLIAAVGAFQGLQILGRGAFEAVQEASNLQESLSKTNVVFGQFSDNIQDFASTAPQALGLSTAAALESTATFGNLFVALGLTQEAAADLSPDIVQLAADLASFNNIAVEEAVEKLRSGLVGEAEPLRALGVNINEALVQAKALELGLVNSAGAATEAGKVQARYALILEQTTTAQGDFARTADGVANRQRTLVAEFKNLQAAVGEALLPAFESLLDVAPQLLALIEGLVPAVQSFAQAFGDAVETIQPFLDHITEIQQGVGAITDAFGAGRAVVNQSLEIFGSLATLNFGDFFSNLKESGDVVGDFFDRLQDRKSIVGLAQDLEGGADATESFLSRTQEVAAQNDLTSQTFERLAIAAGLTGDELTAAVTDLLRNAGAYELDAQAVQALRVELSKLLGIENAVNFARRGRGAAPPSTDFGFDPNAVDTTANSLERLNEVAETFDVGNAVDQINSMAAGFQDVAPEIQNLPDLLSDAREALQSEQGGIVEDFDEFFANLQTALAARQDFNANLLILRAMGFDDLADTFEQLGQDSAQALADAITDPGKAAEAEALLESQARDQAAAFRDTFTAELAGMIAILPVEVQLQQIQIPEIQAALNIGAFGGGQGVGDVIVNINNPETNDLVTDSVRAGGIINNVISGQRGSQ